MNIKNILCFGDSNVRGFVPGTFNDQTGLAARYPRNKRWPGVLQNILGESYHVIEEGINGRTTILDEIVPGRPFRNGLSYLPFCLEAHYPIDLVIIMLGTNDTKIQYQQSTNEIAEGMRKLIHSIKACKYGSDLSHPKILVIAPQPIIKIPNLHAQYDGIPLEKTEHLAKFYQQVSIEENCEFLDATQIVKSSQLDGIHLDDIQCNLLGSEVARIVKNML